MTAILITYGTGEGQTAKVADYMADVLSDRGVEVTTAHVSEALDLDVDAFDGVLVGASVNNGRHQPDVHAFVERHRGALAARPSGFFQLSLASAMPWQSAQRGATEWAEDFAEETGWEPDRVGLFAGALQYTKYSRPERWLFKLAAIPMGLDRDTTRNHEYTDWDEVERFATEFGAFVESEAPVAAPGGTRRRLVTVALVGLGLAAGLRWALSRRSSTQSEEPSTVDMSTAEPAVADDEELEAAQS